MCMCVCGYMWEKKGCLEGRDVCLCTEGEMVGRGKDRGCREREGVSVCAGVCVCVVSWCMWVVMMRQVCGVSMCKQRAGFYGVEIYMCVCVENGVWCGLKDVFVCVFLCVHEETDGVGMEIRAVCVYMCRCLGRLMVAETDRMNGKERWGCME